MLRKCGAECSRPLAFMNATSVRSRRSTIAHADATASSPMDTGHAWRNRYALDVQQRRRATDTRADRCGPVHQGTELPVAEQSQRAGHDAVAGQPGDMRPVGL